MYVVVDEELTELLQKYDLRKYLNYAPDIDKFKFYIYLIK